MGSTNVDCLKGYVLLVADLFHLGKSTVGEKGAQNTRFQYLFPFHPKKK